MRTRHLGWLLLALLFLVACAQSGTDVPPAPEITDQPVSQVQATPPVTLESGPAATATRFVPATPTSQPTATRPGAPEPTATSEPVSLLSPEDFGNNRNRLTGELVDDPTILERRPVAVKISNAPASYVRPQSGLQDADLVFEHVTEGPITRFTAILYGKTPPNIGPIRSARLIDLELPVMYDTGLVYSGASIGVSQKLFASQFAGRILRSNSAGYYRTGEDKPYEHTLYAYPDQFWVSMEERGINQAPTFTTQMQFTTVPPAGGEPASQVDIDYSDWTLINWKYDTETNRYLRWVDEEEHIDANYDEQITAANVVVILAPHRTDYNICEHQAETSCQAFAQEAQIWGEGRALIFRDGLQYEGVWRRTNTRDMFTFYDADGNPIPLQVGNSWFQVIPTFYDNPVTVTP